MKNLKNRQIGSTLIEVLLATVVMGSGLTAAYQWMSRSQEETNLTITAQHHKMVNDAATEYVRDNLATVMAGATATTPYKITVAMLITGGKLPSGYSAVNNYGQTQCVLVLEPSPNTPVILTVSEGGTALSDYQLAKVVNEVGASGGGIYASTPTQATGARGAWKLDTTTTPKLTDFLGTNCSGTTAGAGHLATSTFYTSSSATSRYLYKSNDPGRYDQTAMTDALGLATKTTNAACDGVNEKGRLAIDSNQQILVCQNVGGWMWKAQTAYLKDPVANYASLPAVNNTTGDYRKTLDTNRLFTWNGASWIAVGIDQNGNFTVPGTLSVNGSQIKGDGGTNTWIQQTGTLKVTDAAGTYTDIAANDITASGRTTTSDMYLTGTATAGAACAPNGVVSRDATGSPLFCASGTWKAPAAGLGTSCAWYGGGWQGDGTYHTVYCPVGKYMNGWRAYASTYLDDQVAVYCCS